MFLGCHIKNTLVKCTKWSVVFILIIVRANAGVKSINYVDDQFTLKKTSSPAAWPANFACHRLIRGPEVLLQQVAILSRHLPDTWWAWLSQNVLHTGQYMRVAVCEYETLTQCWFNVASMSVFSGNVTYCLDSRACVIMAGWQELGYLVISKRYCGTMMVLHLQCRPTIKPVRPNVTV